MTEIIIPWAAGCEHRAAALDWLRQRLHLTLAETTAAPWSKGLAVMPTVAASQADVVAVHDADVWTPGLDEAIAAVWDGAAWAVPYTDVLRLDETATQKVLDGAEPHTGMPLTRRAYPGVLGGGIIIAARETLLEIPLDPRFTGWGQEDEAWGTALTALLGPPWRGEAPLFHLWHPPQPRLSRRRGSADGWRLYQRYRAARRDPTAIRRLLEEADDHLRTAQPPSHAAPPLVG